MTTNCTTCANRSSCFNELSINELNKVSQNKTEITYKKGETIIKQNSFTSHIYFIKSGWAKVYIENNAKNLIVELAGKGTMLGITSLNHKDVYNFSVVALNDIRVCEINTNIIANIMTNNIGFSANITKTLNTIIEKLLKKLNSLYHKKTREKIAEMLILLTDDIYKKQSFTLLLSRKEMAEFSNVATENMVRILKEFESQKLIKLKGKTLTIIDYKKLKQLSIN